jgi:hypothetical protein
LWADTAASKESDASIFRVKICRFKNRIGCIKLHCVVTQRNKIIAITTVKKSKNITEYYS